MSPARTARRPEERYACPVCLGVRMAKLAPSSDRQLLLDYCDRCGGIWFDRGEVARLRQCRPQALYTKIHLRPEAHRMKCHGCGASLERNQPRCPACNRANVLSCPVCGESLQVMEHQGLRLDACRRCRGVWFDNVELAGLWNLKVSEFAVARRRQRQPGDATVDHFLVGDWLWIPDVHPVLLGDAAGHALAAAGEAIAHAPEAAGAAASGLADGAGNLVEGTGELAGSVFSAIADILGSLFDGL